MAEVQFLTMVCRRLKSTHISHYLTQKAIQLCLIDRLYSIDYTMIWQPLRRSSPKLTNKHTRGTTIHLPMTITTMITLLGNQAIGATSAVGAPRSRALHQMKGWTWRVWPRCRLARTSWAQRLMTYSRPTLRIATMITIHNRMKEM